MQKFPPKNQPENQAIDIKGKRKEHNDTDDSSSEAHNVNTNIPNNNGQEDQNYDILAARQSEMESNMNSLQKMMQSISNSVSGFVKRNSFGPSDIPPKPIGYADDGDLIELDQGNDYQEKYYEYENEYLDDDGETSFDKMEQ